MLHPLPLWASHAFAAPARPARTCGFCVCGAPARGARPHAAPPTNEPYHCSVFRLSLVPIVAGGGGLSSAAVTDEPSPSRHASSTQRRRAHRRIAYDSLRLRLRILVPRTAPRSTDSACLNGDSATLSTPTSAVRSPTGRATGGDAASNQGASDHDDYGLRGGDVVYTSTGLYLGARDATAT